VAEYVWYGGVRWRRRRDGYYFHDTKRSGRRIRRSLHRQVYADHHGPIPEGFDVHHRDENKGNNAPDNLELLTRGAHTRHHSTNRPASDAQRAAASARFIRRWLEEARVVALDCVQCGSRFESRILNHPSPRRFCSDECQDRWRVEPFTFQPEERACEQCGTAYTARKRSQRYCGKACNMAAKRARKTELRAVACAHCDSVFDSKRANARFCQRACALAYHAARKERRKVSAA
jgi:hypothetical protein